MGVKVQLPLGNAFSINLLKILLFVVFLLSSCILCLGQYDYCFCIMKYRDQIPQYTRISIWSKLHIFINSYYVITLLLGRTQCFIGTMPEGQQTGLCWFYYHWSIPDKFFRNIFFHLTNFCNDPLEGYIIFLTLLNFLDPSHFSKKFTFPS